MKFFKPIKRYPGLIDLTSYGAQEQHEQAICRMRMEELQLRMEDERQSNLPPATPSKPYVREKTPFTDYLKVFFIRQYLP